MLDLARDARWGRIHETYGEDPYLGVHDRRRVRPRPPGDRTDSEGVLATAKHFLGYCLADGGRNIGAVQLAERELLRGPPPTVRRGDPEAGSSRS